MVNVLPGRSEKQILVVAHHDQSPRTVQGADNDGSGISILLHLAEIFSDEKLPYTLVFVATDAEEYGMLGTRHYVQTVGNSDTILAGISLDNLGKELYDGIRISAIGQFRDYGALLGKTDIQTQLKSWSRVVPHFLSLWMPLVLGIVLLYIFVALGVMDTYHLYPATSKDPAIFQPKWGAVILFLLGLTLFFIAARLFVKKYAPDSTNISWDDRKSLGLLIVGLCGIYILVINPFSLLFLVPVVGWVFIRGRKGKWRTADIALFLGGGLVVYALIYFFGFLRLHNDLAVLWYLMMMFSIGMISFPTALAITGILGAGLSMVVTPAGVLSDKHES